MKHRDYGTPELHRRQVTRRKGGNVYVVDQFQIDIYHRKGLIDDEQYEAACNLKRYYEISRLSGYSQMRYSDTIGTEVDKPDSMPAKEYYRIRRNECIAGLTTKEVMITTAVIYFDEPIRISSNMEYLQSGLDSVYKVDSNYKYNAK